MMAYEYPVLGAFLTMMWFFLWILWLLLLFRTVADIFRSHDLGGWGKALWLLFVIVLPYLGVLVYVIARGHGMSRREVERVQAREADFKAYVQDVARGSTSSGPADELSKLADLKERGHLSEAEFQQQKAKILA